MDSIVTTEPVEGGVIDTSITLPTPTEKPDHVATALDDPAMRAQEENQQRLADEAIHELTGKGRLIDRVV